jgi:hypothetical protein
MKTVSGMLSFGVLMVFITGCNGGGDGGAPLAPTITTQPSNQTVTAGQTATFTVAATGSAPFTYQWQRNNTNISGATNASYTTPVTTALDNGATFRCVVTNSAGSVTSNSAMLTVNVLPAITTQPVSTTVMVGGTATFTVVAMGTPSPTYQWAANPGTGWTNITGATSTGYTTPAAVVADNGTLFQCFVTNSSGSVTSNSATLTVNQAPTANAGTDQTITLLTASVTLTGTGNDVDGSVVGYAWTQMSGPITATITSPSSASTSVTGLTTAGTYVFRLTVTDNGGLTGADDVSITVSLPPPQISLSPGTLVFTGSSTGPNPSTQNIQVTNSAVGSTLNWTASGNQPWLQVSALSGTTTTGTDTIAVSALVNQSEAWTTDTSTTNVPLGHPTLNAVWTGKEMIVWGGMSGSGVTNTGARYNPATDIWTPISTVNAPIARWQHAAVWTGREIIVWGGRDAWSGNFLNNGGRYDPATDTWTLGLPTTGAPSAREMPTAVWTGTEMIVWGGYDGSNYLNTGARFNPSTNQWGSMSSTGVAARQEHTAVWTGARMIVCGGWDGSELSSCAAYDPVGDSWIALSNLPITLRKHTAVWTGSGMILWGGQNGSDASRNQGLLYNGATDAWIGNTTTVTVPVGRRGPCAAWTGSEMIVWGGYSDTNGYVTSGKRYSPGIAMTAGTYNGTVTVTDPNATNNPQSVTISLTVVP